MLRTHRGAHTANVVKYNVNSPRGSNKVGPLANWRKKKPQNSAEDVRSSPFTLKKKKDQIQQNPCISKNIISPG